MKKGHKNKKHLFHTLNGRFTLSSFLLALVILTASCAIGYSIYRTNIEKLYNSHIYSIAYQARSMVDGDDLRQFIQDGAETSEYTRLKSRIEELRRNMDAISIFIVQVNEPAEGSYLYILDTFIDHDFENALGASAPYPQSFKEQIESVYYYGADGHDQLISMDSAVYGLNFFAAVPVYDSQDQIAAVLFVQSGVEKLRETLLQYLVYAVGLSAVLVILFLLANMAYMNRKVIAPIKKLTGHASQFISNSGMSKTLDKDRLDTGDEIETLADALIQMETDIHQYTKNLTAAAASKQHMAAELHAAKQIQQNLFPYHFPAFPGRRDFDIYAQLHSCERIGGNFYNFFLTGDDTLCLFAGDVSGSGIPATMFSAITTTFIGSYASLKMTPDRILAAANNQLSRNNHAELTVHAFLALVDLSTGQMDYASAGSSIRVLLKSPGGTFEPLPCAGCFPLASIEQAAYPMQQTVLAQGDILFVHTAGVSEAVNEKGLLFGSDYAKETVFGLIQQEYSLKTITSQFFHTLKEFTGGAAQPFDSTVLLFRYNGK